VDLPATAVVATARKSTPFSIYGSRDPYTFSEISEISEKSLAIE
jgi:hypothetical protein